MVIKPKSKESTFSISVLLASVLVIAIIFIAVYLVGAQFRDEAGGSSDLPSDSGDGVDITPDIGDETPAPDSTDDVTESVDGTSDTDSTYDSEPISDVTNDTDTETETESETETETESETETETEPPETTTEPPETTTVPPETTTVPPETETEPPETTTEPPETTTVPPETTTVPPETTTAPPETTTAPPETTTVPPETTEDSEEPPAPVEGLPVYIDGTLMSGLKAEYIEGTLYMAVCDFADAVDTADHAMGDNGATARVTADGIEVSASVGDPYLLANGRALPLQKSGKPTVKISTVGGKVAAPVAVLAKAFVCTVDENENGVFISSSGGYIKEALEYYSQERDPRDGYTDLERLARIVNFESGEERFNGKLAVATVIVNRVKDGRFPDTMYDVIHQPNQFTVVDSVLFDDQPNAESLIAAKMILEGYRYDSRILWFDNKGTGTWAANNKTMLFKLGGHYFYGDK